MKVCKFEPVYQPLYDVFSPPRMADGPFYLDSRPPFQTGDYPQITLLTTSLMLWPSGGSPSSTPAGYWWNGKKMWLRLQGKITTAATPGNLTIEIRYGTTDNAGTILATSAATALAASKSNINWWMEAMVHCREQPSNASPLFASGWFAYDGAAGLFTTTSQNPLGIPASLPAAVNVDTTAASAINIQMKRSGSTAEVITVQDLSVFSLN